MIKTFCDVCKEEMKDNCADAKLTVNLWDSENGCNLRAQMMFATQENRRVSHLCERCLLRLLRQGKVYLNEGSQLLKVIC